MKLRLRSFAPQLVAVVFALAAVGLVIALQQHANASRDHEITLVGVEQGISGLEGIAFASDPSQGESPTDAAALLRASEATAISTLEGLERTAPVSELSVAIADTKESFPFFERILRLASHGQIAAAAAVATAEQRQLGLARHALGVARVDYRNTARHSLIEAAGGSALAILSLLGMFTFFYTRARNTRVRVQALAGENERLLALSRVEALIDALTGLRNRRGLMIDVEARRATAKGRLALALFDLNGFKEYNDTFGHPAGDALLSRLGQRLASTVDGRGVAYRMGGDEFCLLAEVVGDGGTIARLAATALSEDGDGFRIDCAHGVALLGEETEAFEDALRLADQRMYEQKSSGRVSAARQSADVLLSVLGERRHEVDAHNADVAELAELTAQRLGLPEPEICRVRLAAELHDVGNAAIPDAILNKPTELTADEWAFMRRHTLIGERIIKAAPSLAPAAEIVRSSHERIDGGGYPDGLKGDQIPLGARIIAICDTYEAIVSDRPYRPPRPPTDALLELDRCAGTQFDARIVKVFRDVIAARDQRPTQLAVA